MKYHDINYDWGDILALKRAKKKAGLWNDYKKPPTPNSNAHLIYNHRFLKIPNLNPSLYNNNYSLLNNDLASQKKLLHRMEETYWTNWKPSKHRSPETTVKIRRPKPQPEDREFHCEEDPGRQLIDFFARANFSTSTVSADDHTFNIRPKTCRPKPKTKKAGSPFPLILPEEKKNETRTVIEETSRVSTPLSNGNRTYSVRSDDDCRRTTAISLTLSQQPSHISIPPDSDDEGSTTKIKTFRHIDSLVLSRRRQDEPKEHFQQPKCIKLYKNKPKGGTYPLKPLAKKDTSARGSFRLAAPGSPILVTGSSFGAGSCRRGSRI